MVRPAPTLGPPCTGEASTIGMQHRETIWANLDPRRGHDLLALRRAQPRKRAAVSRSIFRPSSRGLVISGGSNPTGAPRRRRRQNHGAR
jgi:hypothetical protein